MQWFGYLEKFSIVLSQIDEFYATGSVIRPQLDEASRVEWWVSKQRYLYQIFANLSRQVHVLLGKTSLVMESSDDKSMTKIGKCQWGRGQDKSRTSTDLQVVF